MKASKPSLVNLTSRTTMELKKLIKEYVKDHYKEFGFYPHSFIYYPKFGLPKEYSYKEYWEIIGTL